MEKAIIFPSYRHFPQPFGHRNWRRWCWAPWALGPLDPSGPSDAKAVGHAPARSCCTAKSQAKRPLESPFFWGWFHDGHWWLFHEIWDQEWLVDDGLKMKNIIRMMKCLRMMLEFSKKSAWWLFHDLDDSCSLTIWLFNVAMENHHF
jgi:hypothetical protein